MIDLKLVRENPDLIRDSIKKRNLDINLDDFIELDKLKNQEQIKLDNLREIKNKVSKEIPNLNNNDRPDKIAKMKEVSDRIKILEESYKILEKKFNELYWRIPNILDETAAIGKTDEDNICEYKFLEPTKFDFEVKNHYKIGESKGWIDAEKGSEISGSRFWFIKGDLVFLQFAIVNYALSRLGSKGYEPILPPLMTKQEAMFGTGYYPSSEDGLYEVNPGLDNLYMIGTSEVPVTSYHSGEIMNLDTAQRYVGYSTCFRREAGSAGKDTKGILRGHQFDKVEMVVFSKQDESQKIHDEMVAIEEEIWQGLKIPYQKMNVCSGDLGNPAMKKFDLEAWMPGQNKYREVTSCSNVGEFQARRLGIRYKDGSGNIKYAHTLNGTVVALGRCLIAIMENYQTKNGDVIIPEVLVPFMGGRELI